MLNRTRGKCEQYHASLPMITVRNIYLLDEFESELDDVEEAGGGKEAPVQKSGAVSLLMVASRHVEYLSNGRPQP